MALEPTILKSQDMSNPTMEITGVIDYFDLMMCVEREDVSSLDPSMEFAYDGGAYQSANYWSFRTAQTTPYFVVGSTDKAYLGFRDPDCHVCLYGVGLPVPNYWSRIQHFNDVYETLGWGYHPAAKALDKVRYNNGGTGPGDIRYATGLPLNNVGRMIKTYDWSSFTPTGDIDITAADDGKLLADFSEVRIVSYNVNQNVNGHVRPTGGSVLTGATDYQYGWQGGNNNGLRANTTAIGLADTGATFRAVHLRFFGAELPTHGLAWRMNTPSDQNGNVQYIYDVTGAGDSALDMLRIAFPGAFPTAGQTYIYGLLKNDQVALGVG